MKVSQLPNKLKILFEKEIKKQRGAILEDSVDASLQWSRTLQGYEFWSAVHYAKSIDNLPAPYNKPEEEIINSYSIF